MHSAGTSVASPALPTSHGGVTAISIGSAKDAPNLCEDPAISGAALASPSEPNPAAGTGLSVSTANPPMLGAEKSRTEDTPVARTPAKKAVSTKDEKKTTPTEVIVLQDTAEHVEARRSIRPSVYVSSDIEVKIPGLSGDDLRYFRLDHPRLRCSFTCQTGILHLAQPKLGDTTTLIKHGKDYYSYLTPDASRFVYLRKVEVRVGSFSEATHKEEFSEPGVMWLQVFAKNEFKIEPILPAKIDIFRHDDYFARERYIAAKREAQEEQRIAARKLFFDNLARRSAPPPTGAAKITGPKELAGIDTVRATSSSSFCCDCFKKKSRVSPLAEPTTPATISHKKVIAVNHSASAAGTGLSHSAPVAAPSRGVLPVSGIAAARRASAPATLSPPTAKYSPTHTRTSSVADPVAVVFGSSRGAGSETEALYLARVVAP